MPLVPVLPVVELRVPQAAAGVPLVVKVTWSLVTTCPVAGLTTVAVTEDVLAPSAGRLDGLAVTVIGGAVCVIVIVVVKLPVMVMVQVPVVVDDV